MPQTLITTLLLALIVGAALCDGNGNGNGNGNVNSNAGNGNGNNNFSQFSRLPHISVQNSDFELLRMVMIDTIEISFYL